MAKLTDPANELARLAKNLSVNSNKAGHQFLAETFGVPSSSTELAIIIGLILERADQVARAVARSDWEDEQKVSAIADIKGFKSAFSFPNLNKVWNTSQNVGPSLMKDHGRVITYLSDVVRKQISYPRFSEEERNELLGLIDRYMTELGENDDTPPFVKHAILDGLGRFRFALATLEWGGAEYILEQFRELAQAYKWMSEQPNAHEFNSKAALDGLLTILRATKEKVDAAKGWADAGGAVAKAYTVASSYVAPLMIAHQVAGG